MSGMWTPPARTGGPRGGGCGWFLLAMLGAAIVLMVIADALGGWRL